MCFSLQWVEQILIWLVVLCAVIGLLKLVVNFVLPQLAIDGSIITLVASAIRIFIWAVIVIAVIIFVFDLIACLAPSLSMPRVH